MMCLIAVMMLTRTLFVWISFVANELHQTCDTELVAINYAAVGVSAVLLALAPILIINTVRLWRSGNLNWIRYRLVGLLDKQLFRTFVCFCVCLFYLFVLFVCARFAIGFPLFHVLLFCLRSSYVFSCSLLLQVNTNLICYLSRSTHWICNSVYRLSCCPEPFCTTTVRTVILAQIWFKCTCVRSTFVLDMAHCGSFLLLFGLLLDDYLIVCLSVCLVTALCALHSSIIDFWYLFVCPYVRM